MDENDLSTPGGRLRWARKRAGYGTAKKAAKVARVGEVSFRAYENNQHGFSKHATRLAKTFGVSVEWLMDGGQLPDQEPPKAGELATPDDLAKFDIELVRKVDITYAMGDGAVIEDYPETDFIPFSLGFLRQFARGTTNKLFIASGIGDSMEPTLRREDLVMIDTAQKRLTMSDDIWALAYAGGGMIKRLRPLPGGRILVLSDNPVVPPQEVDGEDVYIVGKVVWSARMM